MKSKLNIQKQDPISIFCLAPQSGKMSLEGRARSHGPIFSRPLISTVSLGYSFNLMEFQFPHLKMEITTHHPPAHRVIMTEIEMK